MNFLAHLAVARALFPEAPPALGLGAMLPDLAAIAGLRCPREAPGALGDGVRLHHHTDAVFHELPVVTAVMQEARTTLERAGVRRGPARAAAHVGYELQLDAALAVTDDALLPAYEATLHAALSDGAARFATPLDDARFTELCTTLLRLAPRTRLTDAPHVAQRLARALAARPRLALTDAELPALTAVLARQWPSVHGASAGVVGTVVAALRSEG